MHSPLDPAPPPPLPDSWQVQVRLARKLSRESGWGTSLGSSVAVHVTAVASLMASSWLWQSAGQWVLIPPEHGASSAASRERQLIEVTAPMSGASEAMEAAPTVSVASAPRETEPAPQPVAISPVGTLPPPSAPPLEHETQELAAMEPTEAPAERADMLTEPNPVPVEEPPTFARHERAITPSTLATPTAAKAAQRAEGASAASTPSRGAQSVPSPIFNPTPIYPAQLMAARVEGLVKLRVELDDAGRVVRAAVSKTSGHAAFDRAALDVIYRWRFTSSTASAPSQRVLVVPIRFGIVE